MAPRNLSSQHIITPENWDKLTFIQPQPQLQLQKWCKCRTVTILTFELNLEKLCIRFLTPFIFGWIALNSSWRFNWTLSPGRFPEKVQRSQISKFHGAEDLTPEPILSAFKSESKGNWSNTGCNHWQAGRRKKIKRVKLNQLGIHTLKCIQSLKISTPSPFPFSEHKSAWKNGNVPFPPSSLAPFQLVTCITLCDVPICR